MLYTNDPNSTHHGAIAINAAKASEAAASARERMQQDISRGTASAEALIAQVFNAVPEDHVIPGKAMAVGYDDTGLFVNAGDDLSFEKVHPWAFGQIAERVSGKRHLSRGLKTLVENGGWEAELSCKVINEFLERGDQRYLVRAVGGEMRGFLSNRYRRLNSRDLIGAFVEASRNLNAVPIDGVGTDTRVALRMALPEVFEPVKNEPVCFYIELRNSDFGNGAFALSMGVNRLWCLNKATMFDEMEQVHLGKRLTEDFDFSEKTLKHDTDTMISAINDIVPQAVGEKAIEQRCELIRRADERQLKWADVKAKLGKKLLKAELETVQGLFESEDVSVQSLPEKPSAWRLSNVLSLLANRAEDNEKRLELQSMAGDILRAGEKAAA